MERKKKNWKIIPLLEDPPIINNPLIPFPILLLSLYLLSIASSLWTIIGQHEQHPFHSTRFAPKQSYDRWFTLFILGWATAEIHYPLAGQIVEMECNAGRVSTSTDVHTCSPLLWMSEIYISWNTFLIIIWLLRLSWLSFS